MFSKSEIFKAAWAEFNALKAYPVEKRATVDCSFSACLRFAWKMAKAKAARLANPRIVELERKLEETSYLPAHMGQTRRSCAAAIQLELSQLRKAA